jgi:NADH dehydrogenase
LVEQLGLPLERGRIAVDDQLRVAGHPRVFACGDAAAVLDVTPPGQLTAMTALHAVRQGGHDAAANPLNVALSGLPAKAVTRAYHLAAMPDNRIRTTLDAGRSSFGSEWRSRAAD